MIHGESKFYGNKMSGLLLSDLMKKKGKDVFRI